MKPMNFPRRREQRRKDAEERAASKRAPAAQLKWLDRRGFAAKRERKRLGA